MSRYETKYERDTYHVLLFSEEGGKTKVKTGFKSLFKANDYGQRKVQSGKAHSHVVMRVIVNSIKGSLHASR